MPSRLVALAAAVATDLAAATFSPPVTISVSRVWNARAELESLGTTLAVLVGPAAESGGFAEGGARGQTRHDWQIDVAVRKKVAADVTATEIDALALLVEQIGYYYHPATHSTGRPTGLEERWIGTEWLSLWNAELLETTKVFLSVARLTFRGFKP